MGVDSVLTATHNFFIANIDGFDANNCSIDDESVFNYVQTHSVDRCCVIGFKLLPPEGASTEFRSAMLDWDIVVNGFFRLEGPDYTTVQQSARSFLDDVINNIIADRRMGGSVMKTSLSGAGPILVYRRTEKFVYLLMPIELRMRENVSVE